MPNLFDLGELIMKIQIASSYWGAPPQSQQLKTHSFDAYHRRTDYLPRAETLGLLRGYFHGAHST